MDLLFNEYYGLFIGDVTRLVKVSWVGDNRIKLYSEYAAFDSTHFALYGRYLGIALKIHKAKSAGLIF